MPNGVAQQRVIADALKRAGVAPGDVGYLEVGTERTSLGDPIEAQAAGAAYGIGREAKRGARPAVGRLGEDEHRPSGSRRGYRGHHQGRPVARERVLAADLHFETRRRTFPGTAFRWRLSLRPYPGSAAIGHVVGNQLVRIRRDQRPRHPRRSTAEAARRCGAGSARADRGAAVGCRRRSGSAVGCRSRGGSAVGCRRRARPSRSSILPLSAQTPTALVQVADQYRGWLSAARGRLGQHVTAR